MICVTRKYSAENYVFFFDKVAVLGFDLGPGNNKKNRLKRTLEFIQ